MTYIAEFDAGSYADLLTENLKDVTADLRTIDLVDLVTYVRLGSFTALEDLIHSSTELFFRPGSLISAWSACVDVAWQSLPSVTLGLEFRHPVVSVFFDLLLAGESDGVAVRGILFEEPVADAAGGLRLLARAVADARVPRTVDPREPQPARQPSTGGDLSR